MTKADIITRIYEKIGFQERCYRAVESTFDIIKGA
jgi:nucleoid DNA-binding protein